MAEQRYEFEVEFYDLPQLTEEVRALNLTGFLGLFGGLAKVQALYAGPLTQGEQDQVAAVVDAHVPAPDAELARLRADAVNALQTAVGAGQSLIRAVVLETLDYANRQRLQFNALLAWLGAQGSLTNRAALNGFSLVTATPAQARAAIAARITAGEGDAPS